MTAAEIETEVRRWAQLWGDPGLPGAIRIRFSRRLRTSAGRCRPDSGRISLHAGLLDGPRALLLEVLCHEVAHAAAWRLHGPRIRPHGREWRALMAKAGFAPRATLPDVALSDPIRATIRRRTRVEHRCPVCNVYRIAGRTVRAWRCARCLDAGRSGRLVVRRLPPEDAERRRRFSD